MWTNGCHSRQCHSLSTNELAKRPMKGISNLSNVTAIIVSALYPFTAQLWGVTVSISA